MKEARKLSPISLLGIAVICLVIGANARSAKAQTLYDGSVGSVPEAQGWLAFGNVDPYAATLSTETYNSAGGYTTIDSSARATDYIGYSNYNGSNTLVNPSFPALVDSQGFTLNFAVQVTGEISTPTSTSSNPRAGLSVILLDSQHQGIELGFDTDDIFSQSANFTAASEFVSSTLPGSMTNYALTIQGATYTLRSGGLTVLTGAIKQYTSTGATVLANTVYNESNFLYIGDDTTSNGGSFNLPTVGQHFCFRQRP